MRGIAFIPLGGSRWAKVDSGDIHVVTPFTWSAVTNGSAWYARHGQGGHTVLMHRLIMRLGPDDPRQVDHINHDGLDNRRGNLRTATPSQNLGNCRPAAEGYKGVTNYRPGSWVARIQVDKLPRYLGSYDTPEKAAVAYDQAATEAWGEYACLNFPD